jgi:nucleoside-diphosphate-sugar epimerase
LKVLVTGASGFVGRVAVPRLVAAGHEVRVALRGPVPDPPSGSILVGEIGPDTEWRPALEGMDAVLHLAARVHVMRDRAGGDGDFMRTNAEGTLQLAHAAAQAGATRFVFVSTIKVNGEATADRPFRADDVPAPCDAYGRSKLAAEVGLREIGGLDVAIVRPPLVHGPGAKGNLGRFCRLARAGLPVPLAGIENRRDLVGVENLADLLERCLWHPAAPGQVYLAADGEPLSTPQLYRVIATAIGRVPRMFRVPVPLMRAAGRAIGLGAEIDRLTQSLEVDVGKTRDLLGWQPPRTVVEGLTGMARAFGAGYL